MKQTLTVTKDSLLLDYLYTALTDLSKSKIKSLLKHQCISINGKMSTKFDYQLKVNDIITITPYNPQYDAPLPIIYEDKDIVVVNKPCHLLSVATDKKEAITAYSLMSQYVKISNPNNKVYVIHRLDKDTSGVLMFAKNQRIKDAYQKDWNDRVQKRTYIAIVQGQPEKDQDTIITYLKQNKTTHMYSSTSGQKAITHYRVIKRLETMSLLEVNIDTGRKNQIRVHLSDLKNPIIGDRKYGATINPLKRLGLHCFQLAIIDPLTNQQHVFEAPLPTDMKKIAKIKHNLKL